MKDRFEAAHRIREIVERLDKVAREIDDDILAAKLTRMAREVEAHAAELQGTRGPLY
jgi:uncharacterized membrane-anchored protein